MKHTDASHGPGSRRSRASVRTGRTANPPCLAGGFGKGACKPRLAKPFIESKVSRPVGSLEPRQGFSTRPIYVSFEFAVAVYPVGGTPRRRLLPLPGPSPLGAPKASRRFESGRGLHDSYEPIPCSISASGDKCVCPDELQRHLTLCPPKTINGLDCHPPPVERNWELPTGLRPPSPVEEAPCRLRLRKALGARAAREPKLRTSARRRT